MRCNAQAWRFACDYRSYDRDRGHGADLSGDCRALQLKVEAHWEVGQEKVEGRLRYNDIALRLRGNPILRWANSIDAFQ